MLKATLVCVWKRAIDKSLQSQRHGCNRLQDDDQRRSSWVDIFNRRDLILTFGQWNFLGDFSNYGNSVMSVVIVVYLLLNWTASSKLSSHSDPSTIRPDETAFHRNCDFRVSYIFSTLFHHCQNLCGHNFYRPVPTHCQTHCALPINRKVNHSIKTAFDDYDVINEERLF